MRTLLRGLLATLVVALVTQVVAAASPNLLIITIDDMNCDSVGVYGCPLPDTTPHMDAFARSAMRFDYAHVQVGNCMPSRNVMWSGRYPHNNGVEGFYQVKQPAYPVLCDLVQQAGYFTAIRHKVSHSTPYAPYGWDLVLDDAAEAGKPHVKDAASYGASTRLGMQQAGSQGKPFCLVINIADPHKPFFSEVRGGQDPHVPSRIFTAEEVPVPGFLPDDPVVRAELARYYSSVRRADDAVGSILQALEESGYADETVVLFLSDHGMPFPFAKTQLYHHSTRTPLMIRWPQVTRANSVDQQHLVSAVDLLPTILDIIGVRSPEDVDGRSFADLLRGQTQPDREFVIKEYNENSGRKRNPMRAIQTRDLLYIFNPWSNGTRPMATATNGTDTYRRMKLLAEQDPQVAERLQLADLRVLEELYQVSQDPDCLVNLIDAPQFADEADRLRSQLLEAMRASHDPLAAVFERRGDAAFVEASMQELQQQADARGRQPRGQRVRKAATPATGNLIRFVSARRLPGNQLEVTLAHALPDDLGRETLQVTLKDARQQRLERQVVQVTGAGMTKLNFNLPADAKPEALWLAAFVGLEYSQTPQHIQVSIGELGLQ